MIDYRCIEAFLAVVNTGSISRAAEYLYVSQSSISKWIQALEEEIGSPLIVRHKGHRTIELTNSGKELIPLAEDWMNLNQQISVLGEHTHPILQIAAIDTLNSTFLPGMYRKILKQFPDLEMHVATNYTTAIYSMVEQKQCDIGITLTELHSPNLIITPFMSESYQLLVYSNTPINTESPLLPSELNPKKGIYVPSGLAFQQWYDYWWKTTNGYIRVDSVSLMREIFCEDGLWTICPEGVANQIRDPHVYSVPLSSYPPKRTCYLVTHKYPRRSCQSILPRIKDLLLCLGESRPVEES